MGGLAFTKGDDPLYTPRMTPATYQFVRDYCHARLRELFVVVASPIEGPGKSDFGDIDVFVTMKKEEYFGPSFASRLPGAENFPFATIQVLLGAKRKIQERANVASEYFLVVVTISTPYLAMGNQSLLPMPWKITQRYEMLAIPWPENLPKSIEDKANAEGGKPRFIQVDVHICSSLANLEWFMLKHAHGDLWNVLGSIIRPCGLTVDEVGLYLRIPEIEKLDKKKAKVLLTTDPAQVLSFLGLEFGGKEWEEQFHSMEDVFEYAATSRFFWVKPADGDETADSDGDREVGGDFRKKNLKSNDRRRMGQRPLFRKWIEEFLPKCREEGRFMIQALSRAETAEVAFQRFGVRETYKTQLLDFQKQRQKEVLWKDVIKPAIPTDLDPRFRGCAAGALKKIIMEGDASFEILPRNLLKDENGFYLEDEVRRFVEDNWKAAGDAAWAKNHTRFLESQAAKGSKRTASGREKENRDAGAKELRACLPDRVIDTRVEQNEGQGKS
ncbi:hypothetical protein AB5N19_07168 [Seiridium cardinale]